MRIIFTAALVWLACNAEAKVIHAFVALCDNKNQGIVPVPAKIGNGQDPHTNLYWGCGYGLRTFLKKDPDWMLLSTEKDPQVNVLERCIFKHRATGTMLVAEAYDGAAIRACLRDFFLACSGALPRDLVAEGAVLRAGGMADLVTYCGHDGLMEFSLEPLALQQTDSPRAAIMLACYSQHYFEPYLRKTGATPLVWTTHLMAPEAYTLVAAIERWLSGGTDEEVRSAAAAAYDQYQHCGQGAARRLLVTGY